MNNKQTIYALASARGVGGVAVIRVSGRSAFKSYELLSEQRFATYRKAVLCELKRLVSRETLDHALAIGFNAPHSYTGEDVVEYHVHGGIAVVDGVLEALSECPDHRLAEAGEFTRRAFENGKMDLTEAEGVADLIHAQTQAQKSLALVQMGGGLSDLYNNWRDRLLKVLAYVEAELEFPDEDLPDDILVRITAQIQSVCDEISLHLNDNRRGERLRDGVRVVIVGAPNAGKSSLLNALAQRDIAIVSSLAGTTRDVIEAHLDIGGYPVILSDTAGLRPDQIGSQGQDAIESEGIKRALRAAQDADIRIILYDGTSEILDVHSIALENFPNTLVVINKADQPLRLTHPKADLQISTQSQADIDKLCGALKSMIDGLIGQISLPTITRARHREACVACLSALERSLSAPLPELTAEDLRLSVREIGRITGRVDVEDLLDVVFRDFCIGK